MGKFVITPGSDGDFRFNLKAGNGEIILTSQGYTTKAGCEKGIESVRTNSQVDDRYEKLTAKDGRYYFNLKAANNEIIGRSEMYEGTSGRDSGIASVKANAPGAEVVG